MGCVLSSVQSSVVLSEQNRWGRCLYLVVLLLCGNVGCATVQKLEFHLLLGWTFTYC